MKNIILLLLWLGGYICSFAQTAYTESSLRPIENQPKFFNKKSIKSDQVIPFQLLGGLIIIDAEIDGVSSSCIFDTGAPAIIINKEKVEMDDESKFGFGVTGRTKMKSKLIQKFEMGSLKMKNIKALEIDISHIEKMKKASIEGIIGVDAYKKQEVLIDYKNEEIQFLPRKKRKEYGTKKKMATVSFLMEEQLPVIRVKIGKKNFFFGVDTGAEVNVINSQCLKKLKKCKLEMGDEQLMTSISQNKNLVQSTTIDQFKIGKQSFYNNDFVIMDLSQFSLRNGIMLDGILGYPFLKENLISFDFWRSRLNFWKESEIEIEKLEIKDMNERVVMSEK
jgi:aspartyl protease